MQHALGSNTQNASQSQVCLHVFVVVVVVVAGKSILQVPDTATSQYW